MNPSHATILHGNALQLANGITQMVQVALTDEEKKELKDHPIGSANMDKLHEDEERFELRKSIAKKMWEVIKEPSLADIDDPGMLQVYEDFPPYKFYGDKEYDGTARRAYGVCRLEDNNDPTKIDYALHMVSAMMIVCNDVVGGVKVESVVPQDEWTEKQREKIAFCPIPSLYYDPCAFLVFSEI
jgi:hypothetical protein